MRQTSVFLTSVIVLAGAGGMSCGPGGKNADPSQRPKELVGKWEYWVPVYLEKRELKSSLDLAANGQVIETYGPSYHSFGAWRGDRDMGSDTLVWELMTDQGVAAICFRGDLIGQKSCYPFAQVSSDSFAILGPSGIPYSFGRARGTGRQQGTPPSVSPNGGNALSPQPRSSGKAISVAHFKGNYTCIDVRVEENASSATEYFIQLYPCKSPTAVRSFVLGSVPGTEGVGWIRGDTGTEDVGGFFNPADFADDHVGGWTLYSGVGILSSSGEQLLEAGKWNVYKPIDAGARNR